MQQRCVHDGIKINLHHLTLLHIAESFFRTAIHPVPIRLNKNSIAHTDGFRFYNKRKGDEKKKKINICITNWRASERVSVCIVINSNDAFAMKICYTHNNNNLMKLINGACNAMCLTHFIVTNYNRNNVYTSTIEKNGSNVHCACTIEYRICLGSNERQVKS